MTAPPAGAGLAAAAAWPGDCNPVEPTAHLEATMTTVDDPGTATCRPRARRLAWIAIVVVDVGLLAWSAMAALLPQYLLGPHSASIVRDGFEGYTGGSWPALVAQSPATADYIVLLFRMFGSYGVATSLLAIAVAATGFRRGERWAWWALLAANSLGFLVPMTYDRLVDAVGPFELTEYLGIAIIYGALIVTAPFGRGARPVVAGPRLVGS